MPELPEVEVSRLGITPHLEGQIIDKILIRQTKLRWQVPSELHQLEGEKILKIRRRAKYLIIETAKGNAIIHLGMSGHLRILEAYLEPAKHDHVDLILKNGVCLRYHDPRRFGAWLWSEPQVSHAVMAHLGPEPLTDEFNPKCLKDACAKRKSSIKQVIMDNKVVVGVGNIYACESLFLAKIHPQTPANQVSARKLTQLVGIIKEVLAKAITQGGTTLKDFSQADGKPGYFAQELNVYGRAGQKCLKCQKGIESLVIGQRNTFYCPRCQKLNLEASK